MAKKEKEIFVGFGVDVDAVAGQIGSYAGGDSPSDISRGVFAAEVGTPRMLELFDRFNIPTSWFIPGHSIESFPNEMKAVAKAGHEIGLHGYTHENPIAMTPEQEEAVLDKTMKLVTKLAGKKPTGYVAPWWEMSPHTPQLLMDRGIKYDHSQMHHDFLPYWMRIQEEWSLIDYSKHPKTWMKPMKMGSRFPIVQIPGSWYLDDLPPMMFMKKVPNSGGWTNPRDIEDWWRDQFDWVYREMDYAVFTFTVHPDISGRPQTLLMLERIIGHINSHANVKWATFDTIADDFIKRQPYKDKAPAKKKTAKK